MAYGRNKRGNHRWPDNASRTEAFPSRTGKDDADLKSPLLSDTVSQRKIAVTIGTDPLGLLPGKGRK